MGTGGETVNAGDERTGEKESPGAEHDDFNQQLAHDDLNDGEGDDDLTSRDDDDLNGGDDDDHSNSDDYDNDHEEEFDQEALPPPSQGIVYEGDSYNIRIAYSFSRYLVELLSVRPRFPFEGTFIAFNDCSAYRFSSQKGQQYRTVDSQGNLILSAHGGAMEECFRSRIEIPDGNNRIETGHLSFMVDEYECNKVMTRTIITAKCRKIDVTFVALYRAIQANVFVYLDLGAGAGSNSTSGAVCYVYGEITVHHQLYKDNNVLLFYCGEEDKAEVIEGKRLPLLRPWTAVPVYLDPLLMIKLSLHVSTNPEKDRDGRTVSFQGDLTFDRDQYEKTIRDSDNHGEVKVQISYQ